MDHSVYPIRRVGKELVFFFESNNHHGTNPVTKIVSYDEILRYGVLYHNVALIDFNWNDGKAYDNVATNNGDMRKVLMTVVSTIEVFFTEKPGELIYLKGSDSIRHAYYHKIVRDYRELISTRYRVAGFTRGMVELFVDNTDYEFIVISIQ